MNLGRILGTGFRVAIGHRERYFNIIGGIDVSNLSKKYWHNLDMLLHSVLFLMSFTIIQSKEIQVLKSTEVNSSVDILNTQLNMSSFSFCLRFKQDYYSIPGTIWCS